jgi:hypothetical protein
LHQLSPYIGKLKSSIARDLILHYSSPGDIVADPFAGSGTIPFEACLLGRRAFAADVSPYAEVLCQAKLSAPRDENTAVSVAEELLQEAERRRRSDLRGVPAWVRSFFHTETLREALSFAAVCREGSHHFHLACLLGILHHQRPGFLSYPSSHLVPYLRTRKFPRRAFPEMYTYRPLRPRILAKIKRAFKRPAQSQITEDFQFSRRSVLDLTFPPRVDCVVTSPPYMNALDYTRDNRLRLWFISPYKGPVHDDPVTTQKQMFVSAITALASQLQASLKPNGHCIMVVGDKVTRNADALPSETVRAIFQVHAPSLCFLSSITDRIPDIRRSRRDCSATKAESVLVYKRGSI